jgi:hypothetical protein
VKGFNLGQNIFCLFAFLLNIADMAFDIPFRAFFGKALIGKEIILTCTLYGENAKDPIIKQLKIKVTGNIES